jgi:hypothetical protein
VKGEATASTPSSESGAEATADAPADDVRDDEPDRRKATEEDYRMLAQTLAPIINTYVKRELGKA